MSQDKSPASIKIARVDASTLRLIGMEAAKRLTTLGQANSALQAANEELESLLEETRRAAERESIASASRQAALGEDLARALHQIEELNARVALLASPQRSGGSRPVRRSIVRRRRVSSSASPIRGPSVSRSRPKSADQDASDYSESPPPDPPITARGLNRSLPTTPPPSGGRRASRAQQPPPRRAVDPAQSGSPTMFQHGSTDHPAESPEANRISALEQALKAAEGRAAFFEEEAAVFKSRATVAEEDLDELAAVHSEKISQLEKAHAEEVFSLKSALSEKEAALLDMTRRHDAELASFLRQKVDQQRIFLEAASRAATTAAATVTSVRAVFPR